MNNINNINYSNNIYIINNINNNNKYNKNYNMTKDLCVVVVKAFLVTRRT